MVKNATGGNRAKSFARKNEKSCDATRLRLSACDEEQYACVTKIYGGGMCAITTINGVSLMGHIRSKFSGRGKRNSIITPSTIVLVGMREWESTPKNCDILEVYTASEVDQLKNIPKVHFEKLHPYMADYTREASGGGVEFTAYTEEIVDEKEDKHETTFEMDTTETINFDDFHVSAGVYPIEISRGTDILNAKIVYAP